MTYHIRKIKTNKGYGYTVIKNHNVIYRTQNLNTLKGFVENETKRLEKLGFNLTVKGI